MYEVDTRPGSVGPFAPPKDFIGDSSEYRAMIRHRWRTDAAAWQQIVAISRRINSIKAVGPYSDDVREILMTLIQVKTAL